MQRLAGIITEADANVQKAVNNIENELENLLGDIESAAKEAQPSPKDDQINELVLTLTALVIGAPGLLSLLGKGVDAIEKFLDPIDPSQGGKALIYAGKKLEHRYIDSISGWIQAVFPKKYEGQDPHDETSELHDAAHGVYAAMLSGAAIASGYEAANAVGLVAKGLEGGAAAFKASEVALLAKKIAAA